MENPLDINDGLDTMSPDEAHEPAEFNPKGKSPDLESSVHVDGIEPRVVQQPLPILANSDPLAVSVGHNYRYILRQTQQIGIRRHAVVIQIQDDTHRFIMSAIFDSAHGSNNICHGSSSYLVQFTDTSGTVIMTAAGTASLFTLKTDEKVLGIVEGCRRLFPRLVVKSFAGEALCRPVRDSSGTFYSFISNTGTEYAKAGFLSNPSTFEVRVLPHLNTDMKSILLAAGYCVYLLYYVKTAFGEVGLTGAARRMCALGTLGPVIGGLLIYAFSCLIFTV